VVSGVHERAALVRDRPAVRASGFQGFPCSINSPGVGLEEYHALQKEWRATCCSRICTIIGSLSGSMGCAEAAGPRSICQGRYAVARTICMT
jgi:hypothetical protein